MSILREAGRAQRICCDSCGDEQPEFDQGDFGRMVAAAKDDGWQIKLVEGTWEHLCSDCATPVSSALAKAQALFGRR